MAKKIRVSFDAYVNEDDVKNFPYYLEDLLRTVTLPSIGVELVPLTLETKKARNK